MGTESTSMAGGGTGPDQPHGGGPVADAIGDVIGEYKLLDRIGEGGFGTVWLAERRGAIVQRVALKLIKPGMDSRGVVARFEQERQALALLDHPSVAKVFDAGATGQGRPYFAMEYVAGPPVTRYCSERGVAVGGRLELFAQACEGVHHAHEHGILHRDIKPSNILVSEHDGRAQAKVIDFGIAKAMSGPLTDKTLVTREGNALGTPLYMSPEQNAGEVSRLGPASDVYSLGVTLFELVSGGLPWEVPAEREGDPEYLRRLVQAVEPRRLRGVVGRGGGGAGLDGALARDLETIVLRAMDPDPIRRYGTARALAEDVRRAARGEAVVARRDSTAYAVHRRVRRALAGNRPMALVSAWVVGVVLSVAVSWVAFHGTSAAHLGEWLLRRGTPGAAAVTRFERVRIADIGAGPGPAEVAVAAGISGVTPGERPSWRRLHGEVITRLARAGAVCIASDVYFTTDSLAHDDALVAGVRAARGCSPPVPVVFASKTWWLGEGERPAVTGALLGEPWPEFGGISLPKAGALRHLDAAVSRDGVRWQAHLALQAFCQSVHPGARGVLSVDSHAGRLSVDFEEVGPDGRVRAVGEPVVLPLTDVGDAVEGLGLRGTDQTALVEVGVPGSAERDAATWSYGRVLAASREELAAWAGGRVVLLCDSVNDEKVRESGEPVAGAYYIASGIEQLARRAACPTPGMLVSLSVLGFVVAAGVAIACVQSRTWMIGACVAAGVLVCLACGLLYGSGLSLVNPVGPLVSLFFGVVSGVVLVPRRSRVFPGSVA